MWQLFTLKTSQDPCDKTRSCHETWKHHVPLFLKGLRKMEIWTFAFPQQLSTPLGDGDDGIVLRRTHIDKQTQSSSYCHFRVLTQLTCMSLDYGRKSELVVFKPRTSLLSDYNANHWANLSTIPTGLAPLSKTNQKNILHLERLGCFICWCLKITSCKTSATAVQYL